MANALLRLAAKRGYGILLLLVLTVGAVSLRDPSFLRLGNLRDILVQAAPVAIVACGVMLVIVTAEIDISVGSLMGLLAAVLGITTSTARLGWPVPVGAAIVLGLGALVGLLNGLLVTLGRVPSIIVTLGMLTALRGVTEIVMGGEWITRLPPGLRRLGTGGWAGIPYSIWTAVAVAALTAVIIHRLPFGRRVYALGSNPRAARLAGLSGTRLRLAVFAWTGLLTGLATLISVPQLSTIESGLGSGLELLVVTCVVVGGVSVNGGRGGLVGVLLAVVLMVMIRTVLVFLKLGETPEYWARAIQGAFILGAVLVDHLAAARLRKGGAA